jgi:hypothetical protein
MEEFEELDDLNGYTALGAGATVYAIPAGSIDGTSVYYTEPHPAQPATYDGMEQHEELEGPNSYSAVGMEAAVYASAAGSIDPFETSA